MTATTVQADYEDVTYLRQQPYVPYMQTMSMKCATSRLWGWQLLQTDYEDVIYLQTYYEDDSYLQTAYVDDIYLQTYYEDDSYLQTAYEDDIYLQAD
jgi:hypothetical protein